MPRVTLNDIYDEVLGIHDLLDQLEEIVAVLLVTSFPENKLCI